MHAFLSVCKKEKKKDQRPKQTPTMMGTSGMCRKCGKSPFSGWKDSFAKDAECKKCQRRGHFVAVCTSKQTVHVMREQEAFHQSSLGMEQNKLFPWEVEAEGAGWYSNIKMNGEVVSFKLNAGTAVTAFPTSLYSCNRDGALLHTWKH